MEFSESKAAFVCSIIVCCLAVAVSAFAVLVTFLVVPQFRTMFAELGIDLPVLTKLVLTPAFPGIIPVMTVLSIVKEFLIKNKVVTLVLNGIHALLAFGILCMYVMALYLPLIKIMGHMSSQ